MDFKVVTTVCLGLALVVLIALRHRLVQPSVCGTNHVI